jgi:kynurenine formamidase
MRMLIDLTLPLLEGMPYYLPPTMLLKVKNIELDWTRVTEVNFGSHTGTHVNLPLCGYL